MKSRDEVKKALIALGLSFFIICFITGVIVYVKL